MSRPLRVLVVDDAHFAREHICELIRRAGHEVVGTAEDGREALELYEKLKPDLMTLDVVMPVMGGLDALRQLIAREPDARVIICSSVNDEATLMAAALAGARDYVTKPIDEESLAMAVAKAAGRGRAGR